MRDRKVSICGLEPEKGYIWVLSKKGLENEFVRTMFNRYDMNKLVPGKWILNGYVVQEKEEDINDNEPDNEGC